MKKHATSVDFVMHMGWSSVFPPATYVSNIRPTAGKSDSLNRHVAKTAKERKQLSVSVSLHIDILSIPYQLR